MQDVRLRLLFEALSRNSAQVLDLFREWDTDGSASVDREEFTRAIHALGFDYR